MVPRIPLPLPYPPSGGPPGSPYIGPGGGIIDGSYPGGGKYGCPSGPTGPLGPIPGGGSVDGPPRGGGGGDFGWPNVSPAPTVRTASAPRIPLRIFPTPWSADLWQSDPMMRRPDGDVSLLYP